jgi:hypothetical protein
MPLAIDEERFATQETLDLTRPQGTPQGLPVKQIPHLEFPRCVYKHPTQPFREVLHRNVNHEVVEREIVATEHLVHVCKDKEEFDARLKAGWVREPYIPQAPPDPTAHLYEAGKNEPGKNGAAK